MSSRHIFLDTEVFVAGNFDFSPDSHLGRLADASRSGRVVIHLTDIVVAEVKHQIGARVANAQSALHSTRSKARILRQTESHPFGAIFEEFDLAEAERDLIASFEAFLDDAHINVITSGDITILGILPLYQERVPPFGVGKKKSEFPDAFSCEALKSWCRRTGERLWVVSADPDLQSVVEVTDEFIGVSNVTDILEELVRGEHPEVPELAAEVLVDSWDFVAASVSDTFEGLGFILVDQWGDVEGVEVQDVRLVDQSTVHVEASSIAIALKVEIEFQADLIYDDYDTAIYDSEEKRLVPWQSVERTVERVKMLDAEAVVQLDRADPTKSRAQTVTVRNTDIEVYADEWEDFK